MILVTRLNGAAFAVNPDLLERVEATPDTVLTLIDGTKYLVAESLREVIELVRDYRASVVASARGACEHQGAAAAIPSAREPREHPHLAAVPDAVAPVVQLPTAAALSAAPSPQTTEED